MLVNKAELADILGCSLPTLNDWIRKDPDFPVEARGSNGVEWQFDADRVIEYRRQQREAEEAEALRRREAMEQYRLPLLGADLGGSSGSGAFTPQQELALVRKRQLELEMAKEAAFLLQTVDVRQNLSIAITHLNRSLQSLPGQVGRQFGLPEATVRAMRSFVDTYQRNLVRELRDLMQEPETEADAAA